MFDTGSFKIFLVVSGATGAWLLWRLLRRYLVKSTLDNIPGPKNTSLIQGHFSQMFGGKCWPFFDELTNNYGGVVKLGGLLGAKDLWVADPLALHHIVVKDQECYIVSPAGISLRQLALGPGLLGTSGAHHRRQRKLLNPVFSIANMRHLTPIFYATTHRLRDGIAKQLGAMNEQVGEIDLMNWMGRAALELVGQGGLGYSFDPLVENVPNAYGDALKQLLYVVTLSTILKQLCSPAANKAGLWHLMFMLNDYFPSGFKRLKHFLVAHAPDRGVRELQLIVDTMDRRSHEIYYDKRRALLGGDEILKQQVGEGKDIMSVLLRANMEAAEEDRLPEDEVIAQMSTLTFAGTDTTSNALAKILEILADKQDVQEKLRAEIVEARNGQDIGYDQLIELPYLDAVCRETLRLYPPAPTTWRDATCDMRLPLSEPIRGVDGTWMDEVLVPKGTQVIVAVYSCNRSVAIWGDDALEWKPERWLQRLPDSVTNAQIPGVYSNLMTFFGGARSCIGFKFSQLEMKVVLSILLETFRIFPSGKEIVWKRSAVNFPTVGWESNEPSLPFRVEFVKRD